MHHKRVLVYLGEENSFLVYTLKSSMLMVRLRILELYEDFIVFV